MRPAVCVIAAVPPRGLAVASACLRDMSVSPDPPRPSPPTIDHPATSFGPRCAIATPTATIRVPVDHPTIDHRARLWDRVRKIAPHHLRFFFKKTKAI